MKMEPYTLTAFKAKKYDESIYHRLWKSESKKHHPDFNIPGERVAYWRLPKFLIGAAKKAIRLNQFIRITELCSAWYVYYHIDQNMIEIRFHAPLTLFNTLIALTIFLSCNMSYGDSRVMYYHKKIVNLHFKYHDLLHNEFYRCDDEILFDELRKYFIITIKNIVNDS